ncbi:hypothetical protein FJY70_04500 [candidate division WOR-3 bacterium]|nr:hypothetical protein [candidate division WOR-3 bacterium]
MDSPTSPVELNRATAAVLDEIRAGAKNPLYGTAPATASAELKRLVVPLLEGSGLPRLAIMHYGWFLREVALLWRSRTGRDLAFYLELCIRKWVGFGLEPNTLQFFVCELFQRLKTKGSVIHQPAE